MPISFQTKAALVRRTGSLRLSRREAGGWTTIRNCSNIVLQVFANTGLLIQRKTGSQFIRLSLMILQNILSLRLSKPGSTMIWRLISIQ